MNFEIEGSAGVKPAATSLTKRARVLVAAGFMPALRLISQFLLLLLLSFSIASASDNSLLDAVKQKNVSAVRALLQKHVDVNAPEGDGATALHWAVYRDDA